jgi:hypothetical protein
MEAAIPDVETAWLNLWDSLGVASSGTATLAVEESYEIPLTAHLSLLNSRLDHLANGSSRQAK